MDDVRTRLRVASQLVEVPDRAWEALWERRLRSRRRQRVAALAVALIVGAGSIGGVAVLLSRVGDAATVRPAWEPSRRLALEPGEYFYLRITSDEAPDGHIRDIQTWWSPDGSGEVRNRSTRQDKYPYPASGVYGVGEFPEPYDLSRLWPEPEMLAEQLREGTFEGAVALLLEIPYAGPELRAALFEVASRLDGVRVIEQTHDPVDRPAIALETSERDGEDAATWRAYFDPGTHQLLAWTFASSRGGSAWILVESGIVGEAGVLPDRDQWLAPPLP